MEIKDNLRSEGKCTIYFDQEPCSHIGCLNHVSHPCEVCGRIAGRGKVKIYEYSLFGYDGKTIDYSKVFKYG
jgi:hypothetical protein